MQMHPVLAHHVMFCPRIWEIVHLDIVDDALAYDAQAVLP